MEAKMKKTGREISVLMGITISLCLSLVGTISSGHFTWIGFLISFAASVIISLIIGFLVPMKKVTDSVDAKAGVRPGSLPARFLESLISDLIYTPIITFCMVLIAYGMAKRMAPQAPLNFWMMFLPSLLICMIAGYILIFILMPAFMKLVFKRNGIGDPGAPGH